MGDIKSAFELAMEKTRELGQITDEERLSWKYIPEGEKLAAKYLKEDTNLVAELNHYEETARKYVVRGATDIMARHITLPRDDFAKKNNKRAMEGLKVLKSDKIAVENVYSQIRRLFSHYVDQGTQQRKQAYESFKAEFQARLQEAMQKQGLSTRVRIDVEKQPQFHEEWRRVQNQLESQYLKLLAEYKQGLLAIS
ncbi:MAG: hypothetical protein PHU08_00770 [Dehalococcoidales bacterium]|nr:hypothetical protein [Dehalococcoidales bacterium]